jgi:hypothetical protein
MTLSIVEINTSLCGRLIPCDTIWILESVDVEGFMMLVLSVWLHSSSIVNPSPISNDRLATPYFLCSKDVTRLVNASTLVLIRSAPLDALAVLESATLHFLRQRLHSQL